MMNTKRSSQADKILAYLKTGKSINPREAQELYNCWRLGDVCWKLRKRGHEVVNLSKVGEFAKYAIYDETKK